MVERPASVVKELIENAIDADADKITIKLKNNGLDLIQVEDNGKGIDEENLSVAPDSHTTSKLAKLEDLENIHSMGFRGEALASIASVSNLSIISKTKNSDSGKEITINYGKKSEVKETSSNTGTNVSVKQLFHKIPARKKFLKSPQTEYRHILEIFNNYALAFPNITFKLVKDENAIHNLPAINKESKNEEIKVRIHDLFGDKISRNVVPVNYDSPYVQINGLIGHPQIARSRKSHQMTFLNKRPISDPIISKAVYNAHRGLIPKGKYPVFFLFLKMNPSDVDVNVHPRKSEVRFREGQRVFRSIQDAVRSAILKFLQKDSKEAFKEYGKKFQKAKETRKNSDFKSKYTSYRKRPSQKTTREAVEFTKSLLEKTKQSNIRRGVDFTGAIQVFNSFIIIQKEEELLFIDQHAAAERVTYEQLKGQIDHEKIETQGLLMGEVINLSERDFQLIKSVRKDLENLGIKINIFGQKDIKVESLPAILEKSNVNDLITDIIDSLNEVGDLEEIPQAFEDAKKHVIETMACHSSIRAGMKLEQREIDDLITKLLKCKNPYSCPHGRPIVWKMEKYKLEKKFKRH